MTESFYEVLGVDADASDEEIQAAYREQLKETHPDVSDDPDAEVETKRLVEAKETLLDPDERARYDRLGHDAYVGATGSGFGGGGTEASSGVHRDGERTAGEDGNGDGVYGEPFWWTDPGDATEGPTNDRTGPWERRARERRARERVDTEDDPDGYTGGQDDTEGSTGGRDGPERSTGRGVGTGSAGPGDSDGGVHDGGPNRTGSSRGHGPGTSVGGSGGGQTATAGGGGATVTAGGRTPPWSASRVEVDVEPGDVRNRGPWITVEESAATVVAGVFLYPVLVAGAVMPSFPLWVNVVVAFCTVAVIAALQSMPGVGVLVFATWSLGGTVGLAVAGVPPLSLLGLLVVGATWFPLGLTLLTYWILQK